LGIPQARSHSAKKPVERRGPAEVGQKSSGGGRRQAGRVNAANVIPPVLRQVYGASVTRLMHGKTQEAASVHDSKTRPQAVGQAGRASQAAQQPDPSNLLNPNAIGAPSRQRAAGFRLGPARTPLAAVGDVLFTKELKQLSIGFRQPFGQNQFTRFLIQGPEMSAAVTGSSSRPVHAFSQMHARFSAPPFLLDDERHRLSPFYR
jgi:hypothetical protein